MYLSRCPRIIYWKDYFSPLNDVGTFVKNQLLVNTRIYCWTLNSIPSTYVYLYGNITLSWLFNLCTNFCIGDMWVLQSGSFFRLFCLFWFPVFPYKYWDQLVNFCMFYVPFLLPRSQFGFLLYLHSFSWSIWGFWEGWLCQAHAKHFLCMIPLHPQKSYDVSRVTMPILQIPWSVSEGSEAFRVS